MAARLENKICVITGAGRGIGRVAAELFAREGAVVVILEIDKACGSDTARAIQAEGGAAEFMRADVSDMASIKAVIKGILRKHGRIDVLYNNASVYLAGRDAAVVDLDPAVWQQVLSINLNGLFYCSKYALPAMIAGGGGSVINTASSAGLIGIPGNDAYTASKGATIALTRSMAVEYGPRGVRVNCIAPAAILTPMMRASNPRGSAVFDEERFLGLRTPLRRYGSAQEVAQVALFLASDESSYLNGAVIVADGGITINGDLSRLARRRAVRLDRGKHPRMKN